MPPSRAFPILLALTLTITASSFSLRVPRTTNVGSVVVVGRRGAHPLIPSSPRRNVPRAIASWSSSEGGEPSLFGRKRRRRSWFSSKSNAILRSSLVTKFRALVRNVRTRSLSLACATLLLLFAGFATNVPPSHAATATATATATTTTTKSLTERTIDDYVSRHMFDEEPFNAFEDAYKEARADSLLSAETDEDPVRELLRSEGLLAQDDRAVQDNAKEKMDGNRVLVYVFEKYSALTTFLAEYAEKELGWSPQTITFVSGLFTILATPITVIWVILFTSGIFRKGNTYKQAKKFGEKDMTADEKDPEDLEEEGDGEGGDDEEDDFDDEDE